MASDQRYDEAKFTELVLYVAHGLEADPEGGAVKLNKALWWAECASVRMFGRSISGAEYQKLKQGPAPRRLLPVRERIVANGVAEIQQRWFMGYRQDRLVVTGEPCITLLSEAEKEIVDQVLAALRGRTATDLSAESHEEMGWRIVDFYETIPMESAYLARSSPVTPKIRAHARQLAERLGMTS